LPGGRGPGNVPARMRPAGPAPRAARDTARPWPRLRAAAWWGLVGWVLLAPTDHLGWLAGALTVAWSLHAGAAAAVVAGWRLVRGRRRGAVAALGVAALGAGLWLPALGDVRAPALDPGAPRLRVLVANTFYAPPRLDELRGDVEATEASLVALIEPPAELAGHLAETGRWRILAEHRTGDKHGIALLLAADAPVEVLTATVVRRAYTPTVTLEARLRWQGQVFTVLAAHPPAPTDPEQQVQRLRLIPELGAQVRALHEPVLLLADTNTALASPLWRGWAEAGLRRPPGVNPGTWPSPLGPLGLAIDHVLSTAPFAASPARPVWLSGSDHRGVVVEVGPADGWVDSL
jgi:endonuclease/exonuclease/phosphatase (EEP) superfamily protein YafD